MSSAFKRPTISRDIQELTPTEVMSGLFGKSSINYDQQTGAEVRSGGVPQFQQGIPQVTSRQVSTKTGSPLLLALADFATAFGAGPNAAANQQQMRQRNLEGFFDREQEAANVRSGQVQQGYNLDLRRQQDDRDYAQQVDLANTRFGRDLRLANIREAGDAQQLAETNRHNLAMEKKSSTRLLTPEEEAQKIRIANASKSEPGSYQTWVDRRTGAPIAAWNAKTGKVIQAPVEFKDLARSRSSNTLLGVESNTRILYSNLNKIQEISARRPDLVGLLDGNFEKIKAKSVGGDADAAELVSAAGRVLDTELRIRSGAQIGEYEYPRLETFVPAIQQPDKNFSVNVKNMLEAINVAADVYGFDLKNPPQKTGVAPPTKRRRFDINGNEIK